MAQLRKVKTLDNVELQQRFGGLSPLLLMRIQTGTLFVKKFIICMRMKMDIS